MNPIYYMFTILAYSFVFLFNFMISDFLGCGDDFKLISVASILAALISNNTKHIEKCQPKELER